MAATGPSTPRLSERTLQNQPGYNNEKSDLKEGTAQPEPATKPAGSGAPDGGLPAWLVVVGAWCTSFCSFGWINSKSHAVYLVAFD